MPPREAFQEVQEMQEIQERPCGATDKAAVHERRQPQGQASKLLNFQASTKVLRRFPRNEETQGMGTVVRHNAPNGEVPRPLRSFCVFVERGPLSFQL